MRSLPGAPMTATNYLFQSVRSMKGAKPKSFQTENVSFNST
jgi:hypothetical protein